jgi:acyl carrier protein
LKKDSEATGVSIKKGYGSWEYNWEYNVIFGDFPTPAKNRSYYEGKGEVAFDSNKMILWATCTKPPFLKTFIVWLILSFILILAGSIYLGEFPCIGIPGLIPLLPAIYFIVKGKTITATLDPQICSAHFIVNRGLVIIRTGNDIWIDIQPEKEKEKVFIDAVRICFAQRFFENEALLSVDQRTGAGLSLEPPKEHQDVISIVSDIVARQFNLSKERIGTDYALKDTLASDNSEMTKLRSALEEAFGLVIDPEEVGNIKTVGQVADYIERTIGGEISE